MQAILPSRSITNRRQVLSTPFDFISYGDTFATIERWRQVGRKEYVAFTPPYSVMLNRRDSHLADATAQAGLVLPDGVGIILAAHILGYENRGRVSGPTLMLKVCDWGRKYGYRHYFYGGAEDVPGALQDRLSARYPGLQIAGTYSPPFHELSDEEDQAIVEAINATRPDIVWVGLGSPKQEVWMREHVGRIDAAALIGVGAAFDFHSGRVKWAPAPIRKLGLEWAYRLIHEPRRLWRRSAQSPRFLFDVICQRCATHKYFSSWDHLYTGDRRAARTDSLASKTASARSTFSVDVEEWFHVLNPNHVPPQEKWPSLVVRVERNMDTILELLDDHGIHATFFWLGWVAERHRSLLRKCSNAGHEVASHGYHHVLPQVVGRDAFREDIVRAKKVLEDTVGKGVDGFRVPGFGVSHKALWIFDSIRKAGYRYDSSVFPANRDHNGICCGRSEPFVIPTEAGPLIEIPISAVSILGRRLFMFGGGYLRLTPKALIKWGTRRLYAEGSPLIVYIHPREIDTEQPRLPLNSLHGLRYYVNLKSTTPKLLWMFRHFDFLPMSELAGGVKLRMNSPDYASLAVDSLEE